MTDHYERVGIGEYKIARAPVILSSLGLGSCVGVCIYDPEIKLGGLAHIMLPEGHSHTANPGKFANTAIPCLIDMMLKEGAKKENLIVKIVGGAQMFCFKDKKDMMQIGFRNIAMVEKIILEMGLKISAASTGGNVGKSVFLNTENGRVTCRTVMGEDELL